MKPPFTSCATVILVTMLMLSVLPCMAQNADLAKLRSSYDAAAERALAPVKATYERELRKLLDQLTKSGNLAAANEVQKELDELTAKPAEDMGGKLAKASWTYGSSSTMSFG